MNDGQPRVRRSLPMLTLLCAWVLASGFWWAMVAGPHWLSGALGFVWWIVLPAVIVGNLMDNAGSRH